MNIPEDMKKMIRQYAACAAVLGAIDFTGTTRAGLWSAMISDLANQARRPIDKKTADQCAFHLKFILRDFSLPQLFPLWLRFVCGNLEYHVTKTIGTCAAELIMKDLLTPEALTKKTLKALGIRTGGEGPEPMGAPAPG